MTIDVRLGEVQLGCLGQYQARGCVQFAKAPNVVLVFHCFEPSQLVIERLLLDVWAFEVLPHQGHDLEIILFAGLQVRYPSLSVTDKTLFQSKPLGNLVHASVVVHHELELGPERQPLRHLIVKRRQRDLSQLNLDSFLR